MPENLCPVCKEPPKITCKCPISDSTCANGHHWHICQAHFVVVPRLGRHGFEGCSCPATNEIIEHYNKRWKDVVEHDGVLDKESVMRELHDYDFMLEQVPKVYDHVSGGMISKPNTMAFEVIAQHDDSLRKAVDEAVAEETKDLREEKDAEIEVLKKRIARLDSVLKGRKSEAFLVVALTKESDALSKKLKDHQDLLKKIVFYAISGGQILFRIDDVHFKIDCSSVTTGKLGAQRIGAWHDWTDARDALLKDDPKPVPMCKGGESGK